MAKYEGMLNLKLMRTKRRMTQQELGERIGSNRKVICSYETGWRYPRRDVLEKACECFGVRSQGYWCEVYHDIRKSVKAIFSKRVLIDRGPAGAFRARVSRGGADDAEHKA